MTPPHSQRYHVTYYYKVWHAHIIKLSLSEIMHLMVRKIWKIIFGKNNPIFYFPWFSTLNTFGCFIKKNFFYCGLTTLNQNSERLSAMYHAERLLATEKLATTSNLERWLVIEGLPTIHHTRLPVITFRRTGQNLQFRKIASDNKLPTSNSERLLVI